MKTKAILISVFIGLIFNNIFSQSDTIEYLGQTAPENIPEIFAPGIVSLNNRFETYPTFSPDGKEMFFSVVNGSWTQGKILHTQARNGKWTEVDTAIFSNNNNINWESFISPDGNKQFFASNLTPSSNMDIWMIERTSDTTWTSPVQLNSPVNSSSEDGSACITNDGTLYFKSLRGGGVGGSMLYRTRLIDSVYSEVENLGSIIKTGSGESEPFMAPDESYLIFISQTRAGGQGGWDLWICFKNSDGSWTVPVNMGKNINTSNDEYGPRVTQDGKYLFFTRENRGNTMDIYWVSSSIIESMRPTISSISNQSFENNIQIYPNPTKDKISIVFGSLLYKIAIVKIADIDGKIINANTFHNLSTATIDLTGNPKGIYLIGISIDGQKFNKKICIE